MDRPRRLVLEGPPEASFGDEASRLRVFFDGRLTNARTLRATLAGAGRRPSQPGDVGLVAEAYARWGDACVERLDGMFTLAIEDDVRRTLLLARDRMGQRPLYYTHGDGCLSFAASPGGLADHPGLDLDPDGLARYLLFGHVPAPRTIWRGVYKLPRAHRLSWDLDRGRPKIEAYWDLPVPSEADRKRSRAVWVARLRAEVDRAIRALRELEPDLAMFDIGVPPDLEPGDAMQIMSRLAGEMHEPLADAMLASCYAAAEAGPILASTGADELLAGHATFSALPIARIYNSLVPGVVHRHVIRPLADRLTLMRPCVGFLRGAKVPEAQRLWRWLGVFEPSALPALLRAPLAETVHLDGIAARLHWLADATAAPEASVRDGHLLTRTYLADAVLARQDVLRRVAGVETFCPLLTRRVVELACRMPGRLKLAGGRGTLLREILHRPGDAAPPPFGAWFRGPLETMLRDTLAETAIRDGGVFEPSAVRSLVDEHLSGRRDHGRALLTLLVFEQWRSAQAATVLRRAA